MMDCREKFQKCHSYLNALEEERRKIEMFQRELPLCLELVTRAIEACKGQISGTADAAATTTECLNGQSECSEQTTSDGPVFEEFMPIKRSYSSEQAKEDGDDDGELESHNDSTKFSNNDDKSDSGKKSDWLRSVQLWNQAPDPPTTNEEHQISKTTKVSVVELKRNGGAFQPFNKQKATQVGSTPAPAVASVSFTAEAAAGKEGEGQLRKSRRCWSPELHRRFLNALQQLGGSHVATPKQIKELMKVDGLTNDEVKSHLQKYRLHTRRPAPAVHSNASPQAPQFVVVGGIWVPPAEYAAQLALPPHQASAATLAQRAQQKQSGGHSEGADGARCNSSSTSSSTHTTTAASHA